MKKKPARGHTRKHTGTHKHAGGHAKHHPVHHHKGAEAHGHHVHTVARHPSHPKARGLSLGEGVACCSAEALAASLRLAGARVDDDDVLELHWRAGGGEDEGVSILAALEAASVFGLAGYRPDFEEVTPSASCPATETRRQGLRATRAGLLLGLELPGPHAVLAEGARWWSWGERYDPASFPHARIEECWAVVWS